MLWRGRERSSLHAPPWRLPVWFKGSQLRLASQAGKVQNPNGVGAQLTEQGSVLRMKRSHFLSRSTARRAGAFLFLLSGHLHCHTGCAAPVAPRTAAPLLLPAADITVGFIRSVTVSTGEQLQNLFARQDRGAARATGSCTAPQARGCSYMKCGVRQVILRDILFRTARGLRQQRAN